MATQEYDMEFHDRKIRRAKERAHTISKKRAKFVREQDGASSSATVCDERSPRIARVAIRTCLAKGLLGGSADMPVVSMHKGRMRKRGAGAHRTKASVLTVIVFQPAHEKCDDGLFATEELEGTAAGEAPTTTEETGNAVTERVEAGCTEELGKPRRVQSADVELRVREGQPATAESSPELVTGSVDPPDIQVLQPEASLKGITTRITEAILQECSCVEIRELYKEGFRSLEKSALTQDKDFPAWAPLFSSCSGAHDILDAMRTDPLSAALQMVSFLALEGLAARDAGIISELSECGTLQMLVAAMEDHYQLEPLQELGCKLLQLIAVSRTECQLRVVQCRGVQAVLKSMRAHRASASVQEAACSALNPMAARNTSVQEEISSSGGLEAVLEAMTVHSNVALLQVAGCNVLRQLSACNAQRQAQISALGGVEVVLDAMDQHIDVAAVQWAGCWALFCLTWQNTSLKSTVAAKGGAGAVLRAMDAHPGVLKVQEAGCWALNAGAVADDASAELSDCLQVVSRAMTQHPVEEVLKVGRTTLQRLIATGAASRTKGVRGIRTFQETRQLVRPSIVKRRHPIAARGCLPSIEE